MKYGAIAIRGGSAGIQAVRPAAMDGLSLVASRGPSTGESNFILRRLSFVHVDCLHASGASLVKATLLINRGGRPSTTIFRLGIGLAGYAARVRLLLFHGKVPKNEHLSHHPVSATADARDSVPLCVRGVYQSESVPGYLLLYRMGLPCTVYRDHHSTFPGLRHLGINRGVIE